MLVLVDPASKVSQIVINREKAIRAITVYGFFPIDSTGNILPISQSQDGDILINGIRLNAYLPDQSEPITPLPYLLPPHNFPVPGVAYTSPSPYLGAPDNLGATGPYRLFLFYPPGSPGCKTQAGCFMTGHYDPSLQEGPCSAPDPQEFPLLTDLQNYAATHGETLMEVQSDADVTRVCGATPTQLIQQYAPAFNLTQWLPYIGIGVAALAFLKKRRSSREA